MTRGFFIAAGDKGNPPRMPTDRAPRARASAHRPRIHRRRPRRRRPRRRRTSAAVAPGHRNPRRRGHADRPAHEGSVGSVRLSISRSTIHLPVRPGGRGGRHRHHPIRPCRRPDHHRRLPPPLRLRAPVILDRVPRRRRVSSHPVWLVAPSARVLRVWLPVFCRGLRFVANISARVVACRGGGLLKARGSVPAHTRRIDTRPRLSSFFSWHVKPSVPDTT